MKNILIITLIATLISCGSGKTADKGSELYTPQAELLLKNLTEIPVRGYMFGHQDDTLYGTLWNGEDGRSDVQSICGDYPAVIGFDLGHIELQGEKTLDKVMFDKIRRETINHHRRGGLVTFSWHSNNPLTGGDTWDVEKVGVVSSILKGGSNHAKYQQWLDALATFMNTLVDDTGTKIPVLFRPYHENTGSWFWWGKALCTPQEYKELWIMTWEYLHSKGANHLLYAYSPGLEGVLDSFEERYPGDKYVDLIGFDTYDRTKGENNAQVFAQELDQGLAALTAIGKRHNKPVALTEVGAEGIPLDSWWTEVLHKTLSKYNMVYALVWRNAVDIPGHYYAPYPGHNSEPDFKKYYENPKTLFSKEVNLYQ